MSYPVSFFLSCWSVSLLLVSTGALAASIEQQRAAFLQAETAIKQNRISEANALLPGLVDYPLYPYLLYRKLAKELDDAVAVKDFLSRYAGVRPAQLLRWQWLERLATGEKWSEFVEQYRESESPNLQCNYYLALAKLGRNEEAYGGAEKLWANGNSLPESCDRLFALWQAGPGFTSEQVWTRFDLAMRKRNRGLAEDLRKLLPPVLQAQADFWRKVDADPRLVLACSEWSPAEPLHGKIFAHGVDRLAGDAPLLAQAAWTLQRNRFSIEAAEIARIDRRTALALAARKSESAGAYLLDLPRNSEDEQIRSWRVRAALTRQNWTSVLWAIELLSAKEKNQAQWRYWRARALESQGDDRTARTLYRLAAEERDFYGFIAADRIGGEYRLFSQIAPIEGAELDRLAASPVFSAVGELLALKRDGEARSEWFHAIKSLGQRDLVTAAKLAQRWGLDNLAITTAAKAGFWDDLELRFPLGFKPAVMQAAQTQRVDPVKIFSLVRRESAFDPNAGSPAGAIGLMQLMPATGEGMARRLSEKFTSPNFLLEPARNLRYGAAYLREMLDRFGNHFALASAAYNAGPHRVERWLPAERPMSSDLWVETIPFSETRQYVSAVLAHAVVYQIRLGQPLRRISELLTDVPPGKPSAPESENPVSIPFCE